MTQDVHQLLLESEERFRTMANTAPVLLWMAGTDGLCTFFNQRWLAFTGRTMEQERGNGWAEGVHPEDFQRAMTIYLDAFVERREFRMEYRLRRADGRYRWLLDTGAPRHTPAGTFAGYVGSCIDITDIKDARAELEAHVRERTAELVATNRELEAFTYAVAHDLRAPLRAINGFTEVILSEHHESLDPDAKGCFDHVRKGAGRMVELIDGLLSLSRLQRTELRTTRVDLTALARRIVGDLANAEPRAHYELIVEENVHAEMDPRLARVLLENLLGNAWKFTSKVATTRIELGVTGRTFYVRDNGAGFDPAYADKLFAPFHRLHTTAEFPGTGIGLATVQRIVNRHGGRIWAEAQIDRGATFYFTVGDH